MDMYSEYTLSVLACSKTPLEVRGAFAGSRIAAFGPPRTVQMDARGERKNGIWADFCTERDIRLQLQGKGARPWFLGRRNGLERGIYNRLSVDGRFPSCAILN